jgi:hypothetical protein
MNNIIDDPSYTPIIKDLKTQLKQLMITYENDKRLADFRKITDTDFGRIVDDIKDEESVQQILTEKEKE